MTVRLKIISTIINNKSSLTKKQIEEEINYDPDKFHASSGVIFTEIHRAMKSGLLMVDGIKSCKHCYMTSKLYAVTEDGRVYFNNPMKKERRKTWRTPKIISQ